MFDYELAHTTAQLFIRSRLAEAEQDRQARQLRGTVRALPTQLAGKLHAMALRLTQHRRLPSSGRVAPTA